MGTYTVEEWLEMYGALPEPGEAVPDLDAIRDREKERELDEDGQMDE